MGIEGLNPAQQAKVNAYAKEHNISVEKAAQELLFNFTPEEPNIWGGEIEPTVAYPERPSYWGDDPMAWINHPKTTGGEKFLGYVGLIPRAVIGMLLPVNCSGSNKLEPDTTISQSNNQSVNVTIDVKLPVDQLIEKLRKEGYAEKLDKIIELLEGSNKTTSQILEVVLALSNKADNIINTIVKNEDLLVVISKNNEEIKNLLAQINAKVEAGNEIGANNGEILKAILAKLNTLGDNDAAKIDLLKQILAKVTEDVQNDKDMNAETMNVLNQILAKINNIGDKGAAKIEELLAAINANTEVAKGSQELLVKILEKIEKLDNKADVVIDLIKNLSITNGGTVDLSKVEDLLTKILAKEDENGKVLTNIYDKIDLMKVVLDQIYPAIESESDEIKGWLKAIYEKIKLCEGHNCDHTQLENILIEIKVLIENIKGSDSDKNHEGILDDLDDLLG